MTSAINFNNIDENFPVAGKDNNSQGFRNNFAYIKTGLETAAAEITNLQEDTAKLSDDNDFGGSEIRNATTNMLYGAVAGHGTTDLNTGIDYRDGEYHTFTISGPVTLTFNNWPISDRYAKVRVDLKSNGSAFAVNWATSGGGVILKETGFPTPMTTPANAAKHLIVEAWTINGGNHVFLKYIGEF